MRFDLTLNSLGCCWNLQIRSKKSLCKKTSTTIGVNNAWTSNTVSLLEFKRKYWSVAIVFVFMYVHVNMIITVRKRSCGKVIFYTCLSVILFTGVVYIPACIGRHPRVDTHLGRHQPQTPPCLVHAGTHTPRSVHAGIQPPHCPVHAEIHTTTPCPGGHCCGWYASYWNAFLLPFVAWNTEKK